MVLTLMSIALAFLVSASAGMGGSLILIPILVMVLGVKQGIATAALLLLCNNVAKTIAYRQTIPLRASMKILLLTMMGASVGAVILVFLSQIWVSMAIFGGLLIAYLWEYKKEKPIPKSLSPPLAFCAGATSGLTGTSGPLKGMALRSLHLDRFHLVGAASLVSLGGDAVKCLVYAKADLIGYPSLELLAPAIPLMALCSYLGYRFNRIVDEKIYGFLFWTVMSGYALRLVV